MTKLLPVSLLLLLTITSGFGQLVTSKYSESIVYQPRENPYPKLKAKKKKDETDRNRDPSTSSKGAETLIKKEITLPVAVFDAAGKFVSKLVETDFEVFINEEPVIVSHAESRDAPINFVLVLDASASTTLTFKNIKAAASAIVSELRPQDRLMIVSFDNNVKVLSELTTDREKAKKAIASLKGGDGTAIYDTVKYLFERTMPQIPGPKALIVLTDGVDTTSRTPFEDSLLTAEKGDAAVYPVYLDTLNEYSGQFKGTLMGYRIQPGKHSTPLSAKTARAEMQARIENDYDIGKMYLDDLVYLSGGRAILAEEFLGSPKRVSATIPEELALRYYLTFTYEAKASDLGRKTVRVRINKPDLAISTRGSYLCENLK